MAQRLNFRELKHTRSFFLTLIFLAAFSGARAQALTPSEIAQGQLDAYNKQDLEGFLSWYADDVAVYNFPNELVYQGKEQMRKIYAAGWAKNPKQKAEVTNRMVLGDTVMDKEHVTGRANGKPLEVVAIYKIEKDKIKQVYFVRQ